jgi:hypothetical protein
MWNYGNVEMWNYGNVEPWKCGTMELWKCGTVEMWNCAPKTQTLCLFTWLNLPTDTERGFFSEKIRFITRAD